MLSWRGEKKCPGKATIRMLSILKMIPLNLITAASVLFEMVSFNIINKFVIYMRNRYSLSLIMTQWLNDHDTHSSEQRFTIINELVRIEERKSVFLNFFSQSHKYLFTFSHQCHHHWDLYLLLHLSLPLMKRLSFHHHYGNKKFQRDILLNTDEIEWDAIGREQFHLWIVM